jgi:hypothetical protein
MIEDNGGTRMRASGAWGRAGATTVHLASVSEEALGEAMTRSVAELRQQGAVEAVAHARRGTDPAIEKTVI